MTFRHARTLSLTGRDRMTLPRRVREHLATLLAPTDQPHQDPGAGTPNEAIPPDLLAALQDPAPGPSYDDLEHAASAHASLQRAVDHAQSIAEAMRQATTNQLDHPRDPHDYARQMDSLVQQLGHALTPGPDA